jgi:hypothetical protein
VERSGCIKASKVEEICTAADASYDMADGNNDLWKEFY